MVKKIVILAAVLLPAFSAYTGDLTVDNISVQQDASFYGAVHAYVPGGDVSMGSFTNQAGGGSGTNSPAMMPGASPVGAIQMYAASNAPSGWLLCNGTPVSRTTYSNLFAVIGTSYGGNGSTNFNLPDLRQRFAFGTTNNLGVTGGAQTVTLTVDQMPAHVHNTVNFSGPHANSDTGEGGWVQFASIAGHQDSSSTGGNGSHSNMPPYVAVNFIIYAGQ